MMRPWLLLSILLGLGNILLAQQTEWSNMERFRNRTSYNRIIGSNDYGYYVLRGRGYQLRSRVIIERYRESMGLDFSKKLPNKRGVALVNAFVLPNGLAMWKSRFNYNSEKLELFVEILDPEAEKKGPEIPVTIAAPKNFNDDGDFYVTENENQTHFVVLFTEKAPKGKSYLNVQVYNRRFERITSRREVMDYEENEFQIEQVLVDSLGNAFVLTSGINSEWNRSTPERIGVHLHVLNNANVWYDYYLNFSDTYLNGPIMALDDVNHRVTVCALYSFKSRKLSAGTMDFVISRMDYSLIHHDLVPFTRDFVHDIAGERVADEGGELQDFILRDMVLRSDGGYVLFGEEFTVSQESNTYYVNGIAQVSSRSVYIYGKIFVLAIDAKGIQEWAKVISKGQSSVNDYGYYSSFTIFKKKDSIHILFNDKIKGDGGVLNYTLKNDNTLEQELLFGNQSSFISIVPTESRQLDANTLLIPTSKDRKFAFVKISF